LKQTYERKINELQIRVKSLEQENQQKDKELDEINDQISAAENKLGSLRNSKSQMI